MVRKLQWRLQVKWEAAAESVMEKMRLSSRMGVGGDGTGLSMSLRASQSFTVRPCLLQRKRRITQWRRD